MNLHMSHRTPDWQHPLQEKAARLKLALELAANAGPIGRPAAVMVEHARDAFRQQLERTAGLPVAEIVQLLGDPPSGPAPKGFALFYRVGEPNHCPSCMGTNWHVGRVSAECAGCGTPLPLHHPTERKDN